MLDEDEDSMDPHACTPVGRGAVVATILVELLLMLINFRRVDETKQLYRRRVCAATAPPPLLVLTHPPPLQEVIKRENEPKEPWESVRDCLLRLTQNESTATDRRSERRCSVGHRTFTHP